MLHQFKSFFKSQIRRKYQSIDPDEIFLDSQNLPDFNVHQFEGRIEKTIGRKVFGGLTFFICCVGIIFFWKMWQLQVIHGGVFKAKSDNNSLRTTHVFADRGMILDRHDLPLVWNDISATTSDFSLRIYATSTGLSTTLGYIKYPIKDSSGFYYQNNFVAKNGLEKVYDTELTGVEGKKIVETDVKGNVISKSVIEAPVNGQNVTLSIDSRVQKKLYESMLDIAGRAGYRGGAAVIMDVHTGEIIASANFPEYDSGVLTDGKDFSRINAWIADKNNPFLNRVVDGLYTPGSIVKPFIAMGVLDQHVIDPRATILSTGSISVPNPYDSKNPTIFLDWRAHGYVDLRHALAVSSDVYFYEVSGGFQNGTIIQKGIGIDNVEKYVRMFGFGTTTNIAFPGERKGIIPDPIWKALNFKGEAWRIGDTYHTAIGQYGFQVTPIQAVRATAAIANGGFLLTPTFLRGQIPQTVGRIDLDPSFFRIIREGMRLSVTEGTSAPLNLSFVTIASKTGTAQLGALKEEVNSWVEGFWPYENPHYAFAVVMERGSKNNQFSSTLVMKDLFDWMGVYATEYLK